LRERLGDADADAGEDRVREAAGDDVVFLIG
jgi:hypothetical protein